MEPGCVKGLHSLLKRGGRDDVDPKSTRRSSGCDRPHDVPIDLQRAYKRTLQLTISRLRAYGEKWKLWCDKNRHTGLKSIIPVDKRDRTVIEQDMEGDYQLHPILIQEFTRIQQEISRKKA